MRTVPREASKGGAGSPEFVSLGLSLFRPPGPPDVRFRHRTFWSKWNQHQINVDRGRLPWLPGRRGPEFSEIVKWTESTSKKLAAQHPRGTPRFWPAHADRGSGRSSGPRSLTRRFFISFASSSRKDSKGGLSWRPRIGGCFSGLGPTWPVPRRTGPARVDPVREGGPDGDPSAHPAAGRQGMSSDRRLVLEAPRGRGSRSRPAMTISAERLGLRSSQSSTRRRLRRRAERVEDASRHTRSRV